MLVTPSSQRMATVLIVEDHVRTREVIRDWLGFAFPALKLLEAHDGEEALRLVAEHRPEIVLMDVEMPGMKGIEATRRVKLAAPHTQVVVLSIYSAPEYQSAAIAAGAIGYVPKNIMHLELVPLLRSLLGNSATP
ncbi:MAG: response regulator transcription factor [Anaerolineales bacterium]|nr:response regulator transcription factor [Anaerolineales bacterium]